MPATPDPIDCPPFSAPDLDATEIAETAALFAALADPVAVRLVKVIASSERPVCICHLGEPLGLADPALRDRLDALVGAGLVVSDELGDWSYFSLAREPFRRVAEFADGASHRRHRKQRSVARELQAFADAKAAPQQGEFRLAYSTFRLKGHTAGEAERLATESIRRSHPEFAPIRLTKRQTTRRE